MKPKLNGNAAATKKGSTTTRPKIGLYDRLAPEPSGPAQYFDPPPLLPLESGPLGESFVLKSDGTPHQFLPRISLAYVDETSVGVNERQIQRVVQYQGERRMTLPKVAILRVEGVKGGDDLLLTPIWINPDRVEKPQAQTPASSVLVPELAESSVA